ncbi:MAG: hypothetical protein WKF68_13420 [Daejeonella sp.]
MKNLKSVAFFLFLLASLTESLAQPLEQNVKVIVAPDHHNWLYKTGERVTFNVSVIQYGNPLKNVKVKYDLGPERMPFVKSDSTVLNDGKFTIDGGTMNTPGFLRCVVVAEVNGRRYRGLSTAGFDPQLITPAATLPADFVQFWDKAKADITM